MMVSPGAVDVKQQHDASGRKATSRNGDDSFFRAVAHASRAAWREMPCTNNATRGGIP
ncbi:hypothetical protein C7S13_5740 [Burkholderia cepacia]|nr:hypothetical protein [Burkholderia cepacia]